MHSKLKEIFKRRPSKEYAIQISQCQFLYKVRSYAWIMLTYLQQYNSSINDLLRFLLKNWHIKELIVL